MVAPLVTSVSAVSANEHVRFQQFPSYGEGDGAVLKIPGGCAVLFRLMLERSRNRHVPARNNSGYLCIGFGLHALVDRSDCRPLW